MIKIGNPQKGLPICCGSIGPSLLEGGDEEGVPGEPISGTHHRIQLVGVPAEEVSVNLFLIGKLNGGPLEESGVTLKLVELFAQHIIHTPDLPMDFGVSRDHAREGTQVEKLEAPRGRGLADEGCMLEPAVVGGALAKGPIHKHVMLRGAQLIQIRGIPLEILVDVPDALPVVPVRDAKLGIHQLVGHCPNPQALVTDPNRDLAIHEGNALVSVEPGQVVIPQVPQDPRGLNFPATPEDRCHTALTVLRVAAKAETMAGKDCRTEAGAVRAAQAHLVRVHVTAECEIESHWSSALTRETIPACMRERTNFSAEEGSN